MNLEKQQFEIALGAQNCQTCKSIMEFILYSLTDSGTVGSFLRFSLMSYQHTWTRKLKNIKQYCNKTILNRMRSLL